MSKWFQQNKRGYLLDFQIPDSFDQVPLGQLSTLRDIDPEKIVNQLKEAGVTALYTHARDYPGNCYYNTKVGHKHTGIGERDLLKEFSTAARKVDMTILYYVYMGQAHEPRGTTYPDSEFAAIDDKGNRTTDMRMCMNGPAREYLKALLQELALNYDFDGYWMDCFGWGSWARNKICYCETCQTKYFEDTRGTLPRPDAEANSALKQFTHWMRKQRTMIKHEFNEVIHAANPNLTITYNAGSKTVDRGEDDFASFDKDDYLCSEFHYQQGLGALALQCRLSAAVKPDTPYEIELYRFFVQFNKMHRGNQVRPVTQHFSEMATVLANGGFVQYYDQLQMDGTLDARSLEMMKGAFDKVEQREEFIGQGQKRVPYASIVWSHPSVACATNPDLEEHAKGIKGFHYAMMEEGLPFELLSSRSLQAGDFRGAKVLILPSATCLSKKEADLIRTFVENGGGLVATYRTSLQDESGNPHANFQLADLFGADYLEPLSYKYGFMKFSEDHEIVKDVPKDFAMSVFRKWQLKVAPRSSAEAHGNIVHPFRGGKMGDFPGEDTPYPAAVTHQVGKGRVVYFPQPLGQCYNDYGHPDTRQLLLNAVRWAANDAPPIEVECPSTVEVVLWENPAGDAQMIHLVNRTAAGPARTKNSIITEEIPVHDLKIRLPFDVKEAILQPEGERLQVKPDGNGSEILVPTLKTYSIVVAKR